MSTIGFVRSEVTALSRGELSPDQVMDSINAHIEKRLQDERERIAQAIERDAVTDGSPTPGAADVASGMRLAARIARAES